jgi:hypothetical protein
MEKIASTENMELLLDCIFYVKLFLYNDALCALYDRLCGLVVRVLGYRSGCPGSIPGTTRFSGKKKRKQ